MAYHDPLAWLDTLKTWCAGWRPLSILFLCDNRPEHANTIHDHIAAFTRFSAHRIHLFNPRGLWDAPALPFDTFDVVVIHYSLVIISDHYLSPPFRDKLRLFHGLKVQFIQDDYRWVDDMAAMMRFLGIHVLFTLVPSAEIPKVWSADRLPGVRTLSTLAGYVPDRLVGLAVPPLPARPIDIGYRGRVLPYWLGTLGQEKVSIAQGVLERIGKYDLRCDLAWREEDRIYGPDWDLFVRSCKAMLGTESGTTITDFDGSLEERVNDYLAVHPGADFAEVHRQILAPYEGNVRMNVVSPRIFEAIALRTALILFPGEYSGVVQPWTHYLPLARDFANLEEVVEKLRDLEFLTAMTERAYQDVIASGRYAYRVLVKEFDQIVAQEVLALVASRLLLQVTSRLDLLAALPPRQEVPTDLRSRSTVARPALPPKQRLNVLILYDYDSTYVNTIAEHLQSFTYFSRHHIFYATATHEAVCTADLAYFDAVVIHYSIRLSRQDHLSASYAEAIETFRGLKILFIQDEYDTTEIARAWIEKLGIQLVFTCVPKAYLGRVYPPERFSRVEFVPTLTGYVPISLEHQTIWKPLSERPFLLGYRGRELPYWYGNLGRDKLLIGQKMRRICEARGLPINIEWEENQRLYGDRWYTFLADCQATLGTESGSNVFDFYGEIRENISIAIKENPHITYEEIYDNYLKDHEGQIVMNQISPKFFEAIALKTALVLFEGEYSGIVERDVHYISLKKDFSNVDEVLEKLQDIRFLEKLVDRAYADIVESGVYSYRKFVDRFDDFLARKVTRGHAVVLVSNLAGLYRSPHARFSLQVPVETEDLRLTPNSVPLLAHQTVQSPFRVEPATLRPAPAAPAYVDRAPALEEEIVRLEAARADAEARRSIMEAHYNELQGWYNAVLAELSQWQARHRLYTRVRQIMTAGPGVIRRQLRRLKLKV